MRRLVLSLLLLSSWLALPARAAEQGLGFTAGLSGGVGTHYRYVWDSGWGVGATGALWSAGPELAYSAGLQVLRSLAENRHGRLYAIASLGAAQPYVEPGQPTLLGAGTGLGIQIGTGPGPTFGVEALLTLFGNRSMGWVLAPLPAASLIYYY